MFKDVLAPRGPLGHQAWLNVGIRKENAVKLSCWGIQEGRASSETLQGQLRAFLSMMPPLKEIDTPRAPDGEKGP